MIFSVIPGNPSGIQSLCQEKVFVAGRVSGNETGPSAQVSTQHYRRNPGRDS